ncbi:phosphotransferase family protein [Natronococcus wangiae]|uniref:phosphotransferase family protein n=1 Tax=Natronococcus wangiae TaxID=3068275 RepID=UPI00273E89AD|nr:aminoglycoside phosphotransferase family protein [Natronococcus sp. AD5]
MQPETTQNRPQPGVSILDDLTIVRELHDVPPYRVYEVRIDGHRAVLKVDYHSRGHAAVEGRVHAYVAAHTTVPAPEILDVGDHHYVARWDDTLQTGETVDERWARAAGRTLATLHEDTDGEFDGFGQFRVGDSGLELAGHDDWLTAARDRLEYHRPFLERVGHADLVTIVDEFFAEHPALFEGAGNPVCCHGNVHPEHVASTAGEVTAVIDFEHALVAPGEYDYWRVVPPVFGTDPDVGDSVPDAFRDGYESVRPLRNGFERRRDAYQLVNLVAYVESLYLQENVEPSRLPKRAAFFRELAFDTLERLRDTVS